MSAQTQTDPSWTARGFLAELDSMPAKKRRKAAKALLDVLAQAEAWQLRQATPELWDQLATERRRLADQVGELNRENHQIRTANEQLRSQLAGYMGGTDAEKNQLKAENAQLRKQVALLIHDA